jgi:hypothetical protein
MTKISELPNTPDYPLRALAELRRKESDPNQESLRLPSGFNWSETSEQWDFWDSVNDGERPDIPAASIEDLRKAGMMPEPAFYCENSESTAGPCVKQCAECAVDERAAKRKPNKFYCHNRSVTFTAPACNTQCGVCRIIEDDKSKPSITLEDYARMEREEEAITSPAHYKVCEGLEVVDMIRAVLTPEQFRGYCLGNLIKYRMRAGKKTMSPMKDLGKAHVYETWLAEMEGGEDEN